MAGIGRRRFLELAGGTVAATALSDSIARAAAIPANHRTGSLHDVEHIVVLMQENRSFDHYFGTMRGVRGFGDPRPARLPNGKLVWHQSDGSKEVLPFHPDAEDLGMRFLQDLPHDWDSTHRAWNNGAYDQWVPQKTATTMAYYNRSDIPFYYALADAFTVCDGYHCSMLGETNPNRYYLWSGYTGNDGAGKGPAVDNEIAPYSWKTYPERLEDAGVSWRVYQDIGGGLDADGGWGWLTTDPYRANYGCNALLYFDQYRNTTKGEARYEKSRTGTDVKHGGGFFDELAADVRADRLPQVSWVVAPEAYIEHPNWPANYGAWYVAGVLDALTANPEVWSKTALLIMYDENDGFFDHVVPPYPPPTPKHGRSTVDTQGEHYTPGESDAHDAGPYGLGPRVPMLVVSPWSKGGWVCSQVFDHTSVIRFIERRFGVHEPNISPWRRAVCGDLTAAFDFARTDPTVPALPDTSGYRPPDREIHDDYEPEPPSDPAMPKQEPGLRPARALPYDLAADAHVTEGRMSIEFSNHGDAGAVFSVTSGTDEGGPWSYTVEAGRELTGTWHVGSGERYEYSVYGPNGWLRRFAGRAQHPGTEASVRHDRRRARVELTLVNDAEVPVTLTVTDAYGCPTPGPRRLRPGARIRHGVPLERSHGWYDLVVTSGEDGAWHRRLAGHVETGRPSLSDPATHTEHPR